MSKKRQAHLENNCSKILPVTQKTYIKIYIFFYFYILKYI